MEERERERERERDTQREIYTDRESNLRYKWYLRCRGYD